MVGHEGFPSRSFLLYWRANAVSAFGTYITLLALQTLVVLTLHGSAADVGWLNAARWLPYLVLGIVVGALVDRHPRRPVLVATDLAQAMLLAAVPLLWWRHLLSFPALLGIVMAYGTASVVNGAAAMSFLPRLVPREHLQRAHARGDGADAVAMTRQETGHDANKFNQIVAFQRIDGTEIYGRRQVQQKPRIDFAVFVILANVRRAHARRDVPIHITNVVFGSVLANFGKVESVTCKHGTVLALQNAVETPDDGPVEPL